MMQVSPSWKLLVNVYWVATFICWLQSELSRHFFKKMFICSYGDLKISGAGHINLFDFLFFPCYEAMHKARTTCRFLKVFKSLLAILPI